MRIRKIFTTVDTHTEGGPTRIVTSGLPPLRGESISEKRDYFKANFDDVRGRLLNYPRGYPGMFGAVLAEPSQSDTDIGVFFLTNTGYLDMCVHSALGVAAACLETGVFSPCGNSKPIRLETPSGIVSLWPTFSGNALASLSIEPEPSYVHTETLVVDIGLKAPVEVSIVFSTVFFVLVDVGKIGMQVTVNDTEDLRQLAGKAIQAANLALEEKAEKETPCVSADLVFLYENVDAACCRSAVFSKAGILDRSPCGAGTVAKLTLLHQQGALDLDRDYVNNNMFGTKFNGRIIREQMEGEKKKVWSRVSGSSHVTGFHRFIIEPSDDLINLV